MRLCAFTQFAQKLVVFPLLLLLVSAERIIETSALAECQGNSSFTASLFNIAFTPNNHSLSLNVVGDSSISGNVTFHVKAAAYGYTFLTETLNPCTMGLTSICPLQDIQIAFDTTYTDISTSVTGRLPGLVYGIPDLDATVVVYIRATDNPSVNLACVRLKLSNRKTTYQAGVGWATGVVAGIGLLTSAVISGLGHSNAASHIALYALSLFQYFQAVAIIGFCAVPLPPMVQSWTQNFSWSMGIIRVGFLQRLATWYLIATGGKPSTILDTLGTKSVQVVKRSAGVLGGANSLQRRAQTDEVSGGEYVVKGIRRVAFRADMESTNMFMTGLIFFCIFVIFTMLGVALFKKGCDWAIRARWMKSHRFQNFRDHYLVTLKGILFRILLIGYPQMTILCFWEFTQNNSSAEVALAVFVFFGMSVGLGLAAFNVISIARRSEKTYRTPAYMMYANATTLNKWGFLYIQFRASAYYYIIPTLLHILVKGMFVGLGQESGTTQAIALVVIEGAALIGAAVLKPWIDKPANVINISIAVINFLNAIFLLIFTGIFDGPGLLIGVVGVVFFIANALFALVLLFVVLIAAAFSIRRNPETRYQPVADNRASFIKSQTALTTELDALALTARGGKGSKEDTEGSLNHEDENFSIRSADLNHGHGINAQSRTSYVEPSRSRSLITPSPSFPSANLPAGSDLLHPKGSHGELAKMRSSSPVSSANSGYTTQSGKISSDSRRGTNNIP